MIPGTADFILALIVNVAGAILAYRGGDRVWAGVFIGVCVLVILLWAGG